MISFRLVFSSRSVPMVMSSQKARNLAHSYSFFQRCFSVIMVWMHIMMQVRKHVR